MQAISKTPLGKFHLNKNTFAELLYLDMEDINFNSSSLSPQLSIFEEKLGENIPLRFELGYRDMKIDFGLNNHDVSVEYVLQLRVLEDGQNRMNLTGTLLYDEIPMVLSFDTWLEDDIIYGHIDVLSINIHKRYGQKEFPKENHMNMTTNEYRAFLAEFSLTLNYIKDWSNDVFLRPGQPFPYDVEEFWTFLEFEPNTMYFLFETEEEYKMIPSHM